MEKTNLFYYLDANAFYQYANLGLPDIGLSLKVNMDVFIETLNSAKNIILPSCVYTEILLRFYGRPDLFAKIKDFISRKNIRIQQAGTYIIEENIQRDDGLTSNLREKLLTQKINDEAGIIYIFVTIITNEYLMYKLRLISPTQFEIYIPGIIGYIENNRKDKSIDFIKKQLGFFYNDKGKIKPQELIYSLLYSYYLMDNNFSEELENFISNGVLDGNHIFQAIQRIYNVSDYEKCVIDKSRVSSLLLINRSTALIDEIKILLSLTKEFGYNELQINYLIFILDRWIYDKRPIKKNDVYDFIFLGCYRREGAVLITFDKMILKYLKEVNESNYNIIQKFLK